MNKIKVKTPNYSLVMCDLSAAEVRTACNASGDTQMRNAYLKYDYEKDADKCIDVYSYEIIPNLRDNVSSYVLDEGDIILDEEGNKFKITKKEFIDDKIRFYFEEIK